MLNARDDPDSIRHLLSAIERLKGARDLVSV